MARKNPNRMVQMPVDGGYMDLSGMAEIESEAPGNCTPLSMFTNRPEASDTKARAGADGRTGFPLPADNIPHEPLPMVNQDNNGMNERQNVMSPLRIGTSKPTGNGVGGPLE